MKKILSLTVLLLALFINTMAQDSAVAEVKQAPKQKFTRAVFNSTKIINFQSTEIVAPGVLQFMISHHFSNIWNKGGGKQNIAQFFGLNSGVAHTYLSFDYSPLKWMNVELPWLVVPGTKVGPSLKYFASKAVKRTYRLLLDGTL